jgi:glycerophosphoryl diester phosphodiesterase
MTAEYYPNLNTFRPGTDDNMGVEETLDANFGKIDTKLGDVLKDKNGKVYESAGQRADDELRIIEEVKSVTDTVTGISDNMILGDRRFHTISHRGMNTSAPENTLPAFRWAIENGYWGIECDIQRTSDGKWVVIHDTTVDRTSNGTGTVASKTLAQLKALDFGSKFSARYKNTRIPVLDDILSLSKSGRVVPFIEIKGIYTAAHIEEVVKIIEKWNMTKDCAIISTQIVNLQQARFFTKLLALGYVSKTLTQSAVDGAYALKNSFMDIESPGITETTMKIANDKKMPVYAYTVNTHTELRRLAPLGIAGVTTDRITDRRGM